MILNLYINEDNYLMLSKLEKTETGNKFIEKILLKELAEKYIKNNQLFLNIFTENIKEQNTRINIIFNIDIYNFLKQQKIKDILLPDFYDIKIKIDICKEIKKNNLKLNINLIHKRKKYDKFEIEYYSDIDNKIININRFLNNIKASELVIKSAENINLNKVNKVDKLNIQFSMNIKGGIKNKYIETVKLYFCKKVSNNFFKSLEKTELKNLYLINCEFEILKLNNIKNLILDNNLIEELKLTNIKFLSFLNLIDSDYLNKIKKYKFENINELYLKYWEEKVVDKFEIKNVKIFKIFIIEYNFEKVFYILESLISLKKIKNINKIKIIFQNISTIDNKNHLKELLKDIEYNIDLKKGYKNKEYNIKVIRYIIKKYMDYLNIKIIPNVFIDGKILEKTRIKLDLI